MNCVRSYIDASAAFEKLNLPRNSSTDSYFVRSIQALICYNISGNSFAPCL